MKHPQRDAGEAARWIVDHLRAAGHRALLAGGCVRDRLLGLTPDDYDVATSATPPELGAMFPRARHVGAKFGVVLVRKFGCDVEVATFRADGPYSDGRHPDHVVFGTEEQDARRRDFTINGLFYDPAADRVIDYVGGQVDLRAGVIRTIGDAAQRFAEDHLRMLRAVRFAARFGFQLEAATFAEIRRLTARLEGITAERIWKELAAMLTAATRGTAWRLLGETGLVAHLTAAWKPDAPEREAISRRLEALPPGPVSAELVLAVMLAGGEAAPVEAVGRALRLSLPLMRGAAWLVGSLAKARRAETLSLADFKRLMAHPQWPNLGWLLRADLAARGCGAEAFQALAARAATIPAERVAPPPLLTGDDLMTLGATPGRTLGEVLDALYTAQLNEVLNTRDDAVALASRLLRESGA